MNIKKLLLKLEKKNLIMFVLVLNEYQSKKFENENRKKNK